jgi:hypothetical protein
VRLFAPLTERASAGNPRAVVHRRQIQLVALLLIAFVLLTLTLLLWGKFGPEYESCSPDYYDFGTLHVGSTLECSARLLTIEQKSRWQRIVERIATWAPRSLQPMLRSWTPQQRKEDFPAIDLTVLKPLIAAPKFIQVKAMTPQQNKAWYKGRPYVAVTLKLDTSRPGDYAGKVTVALGRRRSSLPIRFRVRAGTSGQRLLVTASPYQEFASENGSDFEAVTRVLSELNAGVDCLDGLPERLESYGTIILGDIALSDIQPKDVARVRAFAERGGRLILPCNAFFVGTIPKANEILAGHGLMVVTNDMAGTHHATNIISDALTRGVARLEFHRPSPITATDSAKGKLLALDPAGGGSGFVAVTRLPAGGEIVVITASLWWHWIAQFKDNPDNERLLRNLLRARD